MAKNIDAGHPILNQHQDGTDLIKQKKRRDLSIAQKDQERYDKWNKEANGPMLHDYGVYAKPDPHYKKQHLSATDSTTKSINLNAADRRNKWAYYHEHGHEYDMEMLDDHDRKMIAQHFGWTGHWKWDNRNPETDQGAQPNEENFADIYAKMLKHPKEAKWLRSYLRESAKMKGR